jgi:hypothetical protein
MAVLKMMPVYDIMFERRALCCMRGVGLLLLLVPWLQFP